MLARAQIPRTISMNPTASSKESAMLDGSCTFNKMSSIPATSKVIVCPSPHIEPVMRDRRILLFRVAIVEIATMWSGSKACCAPRTNAAETAIVIEMSNGICT